MFVIIVEHHQQWNMKASTWGFSLEALFSKESTIPPNYYMFGGL